MSREKALSVAWAAFNYKDGNDHTALARAIDAYLSALVPDGVAGVAPVAWRYRYPNYERQAMCDWTITTSEEIARATASTDGECEALYSASTLTDLAARASTAEKERDQALIDANAQAIKRIEAEQIEAKLLARAEKAERERRAGFDDIDGRIAMAAAGLAVHEWFANQTTERSAEEVEAFSAAIRRELFDAACDLARPYRDRVTTLEAELSALRARLEEAKEGMEIASAMSRMNLARAKEAEAKLARAGEVHGPYGYLIKPHGLNEEHWQLSMDPSDSQEETSVALYALEEQEPSDAARRFLEEAK